MSNISVSVIIPVYNLECWIEKCIDSVFNQSFQNFEAIAVDDGSKDNSLSILKRCKEKYGNRLKIIHQENAGQAVARNNALNIARGEYIIFLDGDDYLDKDYIQRLIEKAEKDKLDCVVCGYERVDESGNVLQSIVPNVTNELYQMKFLAVCSKIIRRSYLEEKHIRFPEGKLYEDVCFSWQVLYLSDKIGAIDYAGYKYLYRQGSSSNSKIKTEKLPLEENRNVIEIVLEEVDKFGKRDLFEYSVMTQYTYLIFILARKNKLKIVKLLCNETLAVMQQYFPKCTKNKYLKSEHCKRTIPMSQRLGVRVFLLGIRFKIIHLIAVVLTRL